jgi:hypothetical protein
VAAPGAPAAEEGGELHKPAVTTWGVSAVFIKCAGCCQQRQC